MVTKRKKFKNRGNFFFYVNGWHGIWTVLITIKIAVNQKIRIHISLFDENCCFFKAVLLYLPMWSKTTSNMVT